MVREVSLVPYLPEFMRKYKEPVAVLESENQEFLALWKAADQILYNRFVSTADSYGLARFESILGLLPKATDTFDDRRQRIIEKMNERLPYTLRSLRGLLEATYGIGNYTANLTDDYVLTVGLRGASATYRDALAMLRRLVPVNMVIKINLYDDISVANIDIYNKKRRVASYRKVALN